MSKQIENVESHKCAIQDLLNKRGGGDLARKQYDLLVEKTQNPVTKSLPGKVLLNIYIYYGYLYDGVKASFQFYINKIVFTT